MQATKRKPTEAVPMPPGQQTVQNLKQTADQNAARNGPVANGPVANGPVANGNVQELKVTAHLMTLETGLFCIVNEANPNAGASGGLPGVRVSPPPMSAGAVEITGFRPDGWLSANGDAALVRVANGTAQILVTVYQAPGMADAAPRLQVMRLGASQAVPGAVPAPKPEPMDMLAHIQTRGDVGVKFGAWLGEPGSGNWIEGIAIAAPADIVPADLTYQAVLGRGWLSPWVEAGAYCGSRGMALPLLGIRVRLQGEAAAMFDLTYEGSFADGSKTGPVGNDETCEAESLAALEAVRVSLTRKTAKQKVVVQKAVSPKNVTKLSLKSGKAAASRPASRRA
jgi:hypothetical protein